MSNSEDVSYLQISHNVQGELIGLEKNFSVCHSAAVDKDRLFKAVNLCNKGTGVDFAFGKQLFLRDGTILNPLKVDKLGVIPIPVSVQNIQSLKEISEVSYYGKGCNKLLDSSKRLALQIDASRLISTIADDLSLPLMIMDHLGLPSAMMNIQVNLHQLVLYEPGGHYRRIMESEKEYGSFGTVILQLPVKGGHEGGRFKVKYRGKEQVYENHKASDRCFYVTSFYGNSQHSMEPITKGAKLTLIFDIVWENANNIIPQDFPVFLTALKEIIGSLSSWIPNRSPDSKMKNITNSTLSKEAKSSIEDAEVACFFEDHSCKKLDTNSLSLEEKEDSVIDESLEVTTSELSMDGSDQLDDEAHLLKSTDESIQDVEYDMRLNAINNKQAVNADRFSTVNQECSEVSEIFNIEEKIVYFVLEGKYVENDFSFRRLRGKDRELAQLLQCCGFLDTHLAVVTQTVSASRVCCDSHRCRNSCDHEKVKSSEISRWVDSKDVSKKLSIDLNWKNQCVGPFRNLPTSDREMTDSEDECGECRDNDWDMSPNEEYFHKFILVIWPKHHSLQIYCRYGLNSLLDNMEVKSSSLRWIKKNRQKATDYLRTVISLCHLDPRMMWSQPGLEEGELTLRLLRLCIDLRACEESLRLLKIISSDFRLPQERASNMQEIFEGIKTEQVAKAIAELECRVTGWKDCADAIKQMISPTRILQQLMPTIKLAQFFLNFECVEGALLLGDGISSSFVNIDEKQALILKQPEILTYIELIISLEENAETSNQDRVTSFATLFSKLKPSIQCYVLLELEAQASSRYKHIDSCKIMFQGLCKALTTCDLRSPTIKDDVIVDLICCYLKIGNADWLKSLISNIFRAEVNPRWWGEFRDSKETLEKIISSPVILELSLSSELGVSVMASLVDKKLALLNNQHLDETQLLSLSSCLQIVIRMEKNTRFVDSQRTLSISSLLAKLDIDDLTTILTDIMKSISQRLEKCSTVTIIRHVCDSLILELKEDVCMISRDTILQLAKVLIELKDESLIQTFLKQVCENEETGSWSKQCKYSLLHDLISSRDVWGKLDHTSKQIIMNICSLFVQSWIKEICQLLNSTNGPTISTLTSTKLSKNVFICVKLFFLMEKNRFEVKQKITTQVFQELISKLKVRVLLELVLQLHQSEVAQWPNIKKFPACLDLYCSIFRLVFTMDYMSLVNLEEATKIVHCLLWLKDEQSWQSFALSVCKSVDLSQSHLFVRAFQKDVTIQRALEHSSPAFIAFVRIVDYWVQESVSLIEPSFSWHQPEAVVSNHPQVQTFLRSSQESMTYMKFFGIAEARQFAQTLMSLGHSNNFSVSVTSSGCGKSSRCVIMKNRKHFEQTRKYREFLRRKTELIELVELRNHISQERLRAEQLADAISSEPIATDEVCIVPSAKRPKLDIPVVELE